MLFSFIFDPQFGVANSVLTRSGSGAQGFFPDPGQALYLLVLIALWAARVLLGDLSGRAAGHPARAVEAASIDGARRWRRVPRTSCWPALAPVTVFLLAVADFQALQVFDLVYVTTKGGPLGVDR